LQQRTEALYINEMFMAVLGHDLRTPLSAILASTAVLQRPLEPQKVQALAIKAEQAGRRMLAMIEDLLDVTRARQNGGLVMLAAPTDLAEQAERVLSHVQRQLDMRAEDRPMFARGIAGPLGKLVCAVKTKIDEVTYELFLQLCAARRMDVASVLRDCIYALVHGKTYQQMVVERINHDAKRTEALVKLIGSFEGPECSREP